MNIVKVLFLSVLHVSIMFLLHFYSST